jgi:Protein of unknown function (DUF3592)
VIATEVAVAKTDWKDADGTVTSVDRRDGRYGPFFDVSFNYKVGEHWYGGYFSGQSEYAAGDSIVVRYNPANPDENDLVDGQKRSNLIRWILLGLLLAWVSALAISSALHRYH